MRPVRPVPMRPVPMRPELWPLPALVSGPGPGPQLPPASGRRPVPSVPQPEALPWGPDQPPQQERELASDGPRPGTAAGGTGREHVPRRTARPELKPETAMARREPGDCC
jgi:hypothetical protein